MPGLPKKRLIAAARDAITSCEGVRITSEEFPSGPGRLPWFAEVEFPGRSVRRSFVVYVWTIGHGGGHRGHSESTASK